MGVRYRLMRVAKVARSADDEELARLEGSMLDQRPVLHHFE